MLSVQFSNMKCSLYPSVLITILIMFTQNSIYNVNIHSHFVTVFYLFVCIFLFINFLVLFLYFPFICRNENCEVLLLYGLKTKNKIQTVLTRFFCFFFCFQVWQIKCDVISFLFYHIIFYLHYTITYEN